MRTGRRRRRWWELVCEYNLLIQREYPNGRRLNPDMGNWDRLSDATRHFYGDNFPNGEISDFDYLRTIRRLGGQVWSSSGVSRRGWAATSRSTRRRWSGTVT